MSEIGRIIDLSAETAANLFGKFDEYVKKIEKMLHVSFVYRENELRVIGGETSVKRAVNVVNTLAELEKRLRNRM